MIIGYARVSTEDQDPGFQLDELKRYGCERIYTDHASGKNMRRPEWKKCRMDLREGDTLVVWKLDRLARSMADLVATALSLEEEGVNLVIITQSIDTRTAAGKFLFHILGAVAEMERELISERTKAGMKRRKEQGVVMGGVPRITPKIWTQIKRIISKYREDPDNAGKRLTPQHIVSEMYALHREKIAVSTIKNNWGEIEADTYPEHWKVRLDQAEKMKRERAKKK